MLWGMALLGSNLGKKLHNQTNKLDEYEESLEDNERRLNALARLTRALSGVSPKVEILETTLEAVTKGLKFDRALLCLLDTNTRTLKGTISKGFPNVEKLNIPLDTKSGVIANAAIRGIPFNLLDTNDKNHHPTINTEIVKLLETEAFAAIPLVRKTSDQLSTSEGVLVVDNKYTHKIITNKDLDTLLTFGKQVGVALESARLYHDLIQMKSYNENIVESIPMGLLTVDADKILQSTNPAGEQILSHNKIIKNQSIDEIFLDNELKIQLGRTIRERIQTAIPRLNWTAPDGKKLVLNVWIVPLAQGGALLILEDISKEVMMEQRLVQDTRLSSIGKLAAGIGHELNSPLVAIINRAQLTMRKTEDKEMLKSLKLIEEAGKRCAYIIKSLLNYSRPSNPEFKSVSINEVIKETLILTEHQITRFQNIKIITKLEEKLPLIRADAKLLQQVFTNLIINAAQSIPSETKGTITIKTLKETDDMIIIKIIDTGIGIHKSNLDKIFDPFFSTRGNQGTGLGLSISYDIIQKHEGIIEVKSVPNKGSIFTILLPIDRK